MPRLAFSLALSLVLTFPVVAQRYPNAGGGGGNAGGAAPAASPRESGSGGGYSGGYAPGSASREPSYSPRDSGGASSSGTTSGGGSAASGRGSHSSAPPSSSPGGSARQNNSQGNGQGAAGATGAPAGTAVRPRQTSIDIDKEIDLRLRSGLKIETGVPLQSLAKRPAAPVTHPVAKMAAVPAPTANPCLGGTQVNGQCTSCGAGFLKNGQCFACPSGGIAVGGGCIPQCPGGQSWNGATCVGSGDPCPERQSKSGSFPCGASNVEPLSCAAEEARLARDNARMRDLQSQASAACFTDPNNTKCQVLELQVDGARQQVGLDWDALDRCRHL